MSTTDTVIRDPARLRALRRLGLLDAPPAAELDGLTRLAQRLLRAPLAVVCLVDAERQVFYSAAGFPEALASQRETSLGLSICKYVVETKRALLVQDARRDPRLRETPAVTELGVVAYAGSPLTTPDGHVVGTLAVMDFTPRTWHPTEHELLEQLAGQARAYLELVDARRAQRELAFVLDNVAEGIVVLDLAGTIQSLNASFEALTGWVPGDWEGRPLGPLLHPDDLQRTLEQFTRAAAGQVVAPIEVRMRTRAGRDVLVSCAMRGQEERGRVGGVVAVLHDVSRRKQMEALVTHDSERWNALMDHLPDPIYFKDRDGCFTRVNRAQARVLGVADPADVVGHSDADYFPPEHAAAARADEEAIMASGEPLVSKVERVLDRRGHEHWFATTKMALRNPAGAVIGTMGSSRDITDVMQAENELRRTLSLHRATLESTADGIAVVDGDGRITSYNRKFTAMWGLPESVLVTRQDERVLEYVLDQLKDPDAFLQRVRELHADPEASSFEVLELVDGRVFERYSQPQRIGGAIVGRVWSFRDVSERRRTEGRNRLLAQTIQSTGDIISITDLDGRFTFVNQAFLTTYGYAESEVIGRDVQLIDSPRNSPQLQEEIREATRRGAWRGELWNRRMDGSEFPVALTTSQIRDPDGRVVGLVGVWNDISERRRSQAVQEAVYRIANAASAAVGLGPLLAAVHEIVSDLLPAKNLFVALYDAATGLLTFPYFADQVDIADQPRPLGRGLTEYVLRTGRSLLGTPETVSALEREGEVELVGVPSVDWLGVPLKAGQDPIGVLAIQSYTEGVRFGPAELEILEFVSAQVAMAIERTRAAERVQASEAKYRQLFEGNPEAMFVYDAVSLSFLAVNEAAVRNYGYNRPEFLGMTLLDIRPQEEAGKLVATLAQYRGGTARATGLRHRKRDGTLIDVEVTFDDIDFEGRPARLAVVEDVTEQRRLEGQLRQAQKMEAVGQLAGGIAHDFNNLLTAIVGYATLLARSLAPDSPDREDVMEIIGAARRAANLTQQLLAFSRKQVLRPKVLDMNTVVRDMERILQRVIGEHITLRTSLDPGLAAVRADVSQLEQVIMNLAVNARDAMPTGGRLTIETGNAPLDVELARIHPEAPAGDYAVLTVADTGTGMSPEVKSHLFEPFFTTKEVGKGTGLGLATVYGIVRQSGGFITVDSEPGRWTRFRLYFPPADQVEPEAEGQPAEPPSAGSGTVLLVEDEDGVRHLARDVLTRYGFRVLEAADPAAALRLAEGHEGPIDLLLTDVVMPGMSGAEFAGRFLALRPNVPVLYASGYTDETIVPHGVRNGEAPFLQKPFEPDDLVRSVRELIERR
jgi:two-component system cell cycle sensor histidine kinase/response regulator CckA